jgi:hypothetical protein
MGFRDEVRGTAPNEHWDLDLAELSSHVYQNEQTALPGGWRQLSRQELPAEMQAMAETDGTMQHTASGFRARAYACDAEDNQTRVAIAFRGTVPAESVLLAATNNMGQALGLIGPQYRRAMALGREAESTWGSNAVFTGHSLGGGLAGTAAAAANGHGVAVTFNAAHVQMTTLAAATGDRDHAAEFRRLATNGQARTYELQGDFLTHRLRRLNLGRPVGSDVAIRHHHYEGRRRDMGMLHSMQKVISTMSSDQDLRFSAFSDQIRQVEQLRSDGIDITRFCRDVDHLADNGRAGNFEQQFSRVLNAHIRGERVRLPGQGVDVRRPLDASLSGQSYRSSTEARVRQRAEELRSAWQPESMASSRSVSGSESSEYGEALPRFTQLGSAGPSRAPQYEKRSMTPQGLGDLRESDSDQSAQSDTPYVRPRGRYQSTEGSQLGLGISRAPQGRIVSQETSVEPPRRSYAHTHDASSLSSSRSASSSSPQPTASTALSQLDELAAAERRSELLQRRPSGKGKGKAPRQ